MSETQSERLRELALSVASAALVVGAMRAIGKAHDKEEADYQSAVCEFDAALVDVLSAVRQDAAAEERARCLSVCSSVIDRAPLGRGHAVGASECAKAIKASA